MKKTLLFLLLFIASQTIIAQPTIHKLIGYSGEKYVYKKDQIIAYKHFLYTKYDSLIENEKWLNNYIDELSDEYVYMSAWGMAYTNWTEAKSYLENIVKEVLKDNWTSNNEIEIIRNAENNAFMIENGKININVGMLANVSSEAELATIIGHEYAHYIKKHHYLTYIKEQETKSKIAFASTIGYPGGGLVPHYTISKMYVQSREFESEADGISIELMKNSNYTMNAIASSFKLFLDEEKKQTKVKGYLINNYYRTHPPTPERISIAEKASKKVDSLGRKNFIIDEAAFYKIKNQAIDECIFLHISNFELEDAIELCYKQLLLHPDDEFYLFYLNECIRRFILANPKEMDGFFITSNYNFYDKYIQKEKCPKVILSKKYSKISNPDLNKLIAYQYEYLLFNNNKTQISKIPPSYLTQNDTLEFVTYKDAMNFFISRQEKLGHSSVFFTKKCLDPSVTLSKINSPNPDLNNYNSLFENEKDSIKTLEDKCTIIPLNINYLKTGMPFWIADVKEKSLYSDLIKSMKTIVEAPFRVLNYQNLELADKMAIYTFLSGLQRLGIKPKEIAAFYSHSENKYYDIYKSIPIPPSLICPEIIPLIKKYNLNKIIFMDISFREAPSIGVGGFPLFSSKAMAMSCFYVDFNEKKIANQYFIDSNTKLIFNQNNISTDALSHKIYGTAKNLTIDIKNERK